MQLQNNWLCCLRQPVQLDYKLFAFSMNAAAALLQVGLVPSTRVQLRRKLYVCVSYQNSCSCATNWLCSRQAVQLRCKQFVFPTKTAAVGPQGLCFLRQTVQLKYKLLVFPAERLQLRHKQAVLPTRSNAV